MSVISPAFATERADTIASDAKQINWKEYIPEIHGTVRGRVETEFGHDLPAAARFQVRNARLNLRGSIGEAVDYFFNTDFCDRGSIKILDVWARVNAPEHIGIRMGQFRMPFGVDPFMAPENYIFSNRSFIGKQMCNVRAVGASIAYRPTAFPLFVEGGIFNPAPIGNHIVWTTSFAYALKTTYNWRRTTWATGFQSIRPDGIRINLADAALTWTPDGKWTLAGEYMYKHYTHRAAKAAHSWLVWASYRMPIRAWVFNRLSFQGRYDGMTAHSDGKRDAAGFLTVNDPARNRITVGATISYVRSKNLYMDIRADVEKYFYHSSSTVERGEADRVLLEMIVRF
ncbi:MAG: OprO/OprP family phosphate-selective porin [Muribaculaceae bacterium]|nr:OprO/OprP family phosphate-selective porin [Muribaculaceae bacterium]